jgi:hypothetical protein
MSLGEGVCYNKLRYLYPLHVCYALREVNDLGEEDCPESTFRPVLHILK